MKKMSDVADIIMGQSPPSSAYNVEKRGLPFFQGKTEFGRIYPTVGKWCDKPTKIAEKNDVLISVRAPVGPTNLCPEKSCIGRGLGAIRAKEKVSYHLFILYFLRSIEQSLAAKGKGSTFTAINRDDLERIKFPDISFSDQKKIAAILQKAESALEKRREAIRLLDAFLESAYFDMFKDIIKCDPIELGKILTNKNSIKCGPFGSQLKIGEYVKEGVPVYGIDNVEKNRFVEAKVKQISISKYEDLVSFEVQPNDILITRTGTVGRACLAPKGVRKAVIGPNLLRVRCGENDLLPEFFCFALNYYEPIKKQIELFSPGATVAVYNTTNLKKLKIPVPGPQLQKKFVSLGYKVESMRRKMQSSEIELQNLFNALMQKAFNGELSNG